MTKKAFIVNLYILCYKKKRGGVKDKCDSHLKKKEIVVVDNGAEIQKHVSTYFIPRGFRVICFSNAESAIHESLISGQNWDVLLTDFHFLNMSGSEFTNKIKQNLPHLPIILITHAESSENAFEAIEKGAYDLIVRPIQLNQLRIAVDRALHLRELMGDFSQLKEKCLNSKTESVIGKNPDFLAALDIARRVATSSANILIHGESGTGKEVIAKFIHEESNRKKSAFVAINCSAIPENLLESELFGHAKGSFTGASEKRVGLFEEAEDGTLFLDEIGDLNLSLQAKLLRVLQEKKIKRVGENVYRSINCRIICATNKNLSEEVEANRFREDLFFRLNVIPITIPPLRKRQEDIIPLTHYFLKKFSHENHCPTKTMCKEAMLFLLKGQWRGNVRELENTIERAVVMSQSNEIAIDSLMPLSSNLSFSHPTHAKNDKYENEFLLAHSNQLPTLDHVIKKYINYAISKNDGARDKTALQIGIDRKTLYKWTKTTLDEESLPVNLVQ